MLKGERTDIQSYTNNLISIHAEIAIIMNQVVFSNTAGTDVCQTMTSQWPKATLFMLM